jgi:photosystem II stability/assembly factor-like uncharacterized protein
VVKAKDLAKAGGEGAPAAPIPAAPPGALRASPRWAISSSGILQRSFDAGATWEDVNVGQSLFYDSMQRQSTPEYKAGYAAKSKKKEPQPPPIPVFRAVTAFESEVWAGGAAAMLYHSVDSGMQWTRVLPAEAGAVLTGDIILVEFSRPQDGRVATSAGEVWTTADAGRSWHKQR